MKRRIKVKLSNRDLLKRAIVMFSPIGSQSVWITQGDCLIDVIGVNLRYIKNGVHSCKELNVAPEIEIQYILVNPEKKPKLEFNKVIRMSEDMGVKVLNNRKHRIRYKASIEVMLPFSLKNNPPKEYQQYRERWFACVVLKTANNKSKDIVGIFETKEHAQMWLNKAYPDKDTVLDIVYKDNYYTDVYRKMKKVTK